MAKEHKFGQVVPNTSAVFSMESTTDMEKKQTKKVIGTKAIGVQGLNKEKERSYGMMVAIMKELGKMMHKVDTEHLLEATNEYTSEVGRIIKLTATENSLGLMAKTTKEITNLT